MTGAITLRPEVQRFAELMEVKLRENDHKGGWDECGNGYLKRRMRTELRELFAAVDAVVKCPEGNPKRTDLMARRSEGR